MSKFPHFLLYALQHLSDTQVYLNIFESINSLVSFPVDFLRERIACFFSLHPLKALKIGVAFDFFFIDLKFHE